MMLIVFLPKENLYFAVEKELKKDGVILYSETIQEDPFSLDIQGSIVNFQTIDIAKVAHIEIGLYGFYNTFDAQDIQLYTFSKNFLPSKIKYLRATYLLFDPLHIKIMAEGEFGILEGQYNIKEHLLKVTIQPSKKMLQEYQNSLGLLKKLKNGEYSYETTL